jgi:hypothetical protein
MQRLAGALLLIVPLLVAAAPEKTEPVTAKVVKYDELAKVVQNYRGQVLLIDFWGID